MILENKKVLITGGTGSLGKILTKRIITGEFGIPSKLVIFSRDEAKQHDMRVEYSGNNSFKNIVEFHIGDIRNYQSVVSVVRNADIIFNAAALKQVPSCEYFPYEAMMTNIVGPQNIVQAICEHNFPVQKVIGISTDKAAKPVNAMGMTKALQERVFTAANLYCKNTTFCCVRYGNVLSSRGSVIPLFLDQIFNGGPVTITVPGMTRFLLSLNRAVDTVMEAVRHGIPGETYIPNVQSTTIENIAKALIGGRNIDIKVVGIRPGEKMHEILVSEEECNRTIKQGDYYIILPMLPELNPTKKHDNVLQKEFSSKDNVMDIYGTVKLLSDNKLLVEDMFIKKEVLA